MERPNLGGMSQGQQLTRPAMRRAARFKAHEAQRQLRKERQKLRSTDCLADENGTRCIQSMDLKHVLRQIKANGC
jgi:hypothetical protein